jgi:TM2 domain-containing membrane protein YozV
MEKSNKPWLNTFLLCWILGNVGAHRFYVGKTGTAIAMLLTCGGCGIWTLIDWVTIILGKFTDAEGKLIQR